MTPRGDPIRLFVEAAPRNFSVQAPVILRRHFLVFLGSGEVFPPPTAHSEIGDRHETRVRPEFEPSALTPATLFTPQVECKY